MSIRALRAAADSLHPVRNGAVALFGGLIFANIAAWAWGFVLFADRPALIGTALLAWVFGLRHAVDADHIAAIDNVVRKLMHAGDTPGRAGLYFSLGHSTVVTAGTVLLATVAGLGSSEGLIKSVGRLIGTSVSAAFLLLIAAINFVILISLWRAFRSVRAHGVHGVEHLDVMPSGHGVLARLFGPMFKMVTKAWHMYPLGFLFGLGFDTATEVGLLSLSAAEAARGLSLLNVLVFPALFAAAMVLVDTADSVLMVGAYRWAFVDPLRKLWYNLTITAASVLVAVFVGGAEALGLFAERLGLAGGVWSLVAALNENLTNFGFAVIGLFALAWIVSIAIYRATFDDRRSKPVRVFAQD